MLPLQLANEGSVCPLQLTAGEGLLRPSIKNKLLYLKQKPNKHQVLGILSLHLCSARLNSSRTVNGVCCCDVCSLITCRWTWILLSASSARRHLANCSVHSIAPHRSLFLLHCSGFLQQSDCNTSDVQEAFISWRNSRVHWHPIATCTNVFSMPLLCRLWSSLP